MRRQDSNLRPPGYEPDELPTALLRDIQLALLECLGIIAQLFLFVNPLFLIEALTSFAENNIINKYVFFPKKGVCILG